MFSKRTGRGMEESSGAPGSPPALSGAAPGAAGTSTASTSGPLWPGGLGSICFSIILRYVSIAARAHWWARSVWIEAAIFFFERAVAASAAAAIILSALTAGRTIRLGLRGGCVSTSFQGFHRVGTAVRISAELASQVALDSG